MKAVMVLCAVTAAAAAAPVLHGQSDPYPGIHRESWDDPAIPARIHLVRIDLTSAELALYATREADGGITTSAFASRTSAQVAINGGPFEVAGYRPRGLAMGGSQLWSNTRDDAQTYVLQFRRAGERTVAEILTPDVVTTPADLPPGTEGVVSGRPLLVRNGVVVTGFDSADPVSIPYTRAPRSAVAVSADGNRMWLATVDGWQAGSIGLTAAELGAFLRDRGAHTALGLDLGGSSTLVLGGAVINSPSDGVERTVANHIAVKYGQLPAGQLTGAICRTDITDCPDPDKLVGVELTLDDGRTDKTTPSALLYSFQGVTPRLACVTARKTGYKTRTACKVVTAGINPPTYNSIQLEPGDDPLPDAGVPDGSLPDDASDGIDPPPRPDARNHEQGPGGGCCNTGGAHPPAGVVVLVVGVAFGVRRRRGTKA